MTSNLKTTLHSYSFNLREAGGRDAYDALLEKLKGYPRKMRALGRFYFGETGNGVAIELEPLHLFENQWNTAPVPALKSGDKGLRVFDWAEEAGDHYDRGIRRGHYLDQTAEMRSVRDNTNACGYCGFQEEAQRGAVFCPRCIGSENLKASELYLTRMVPVSVRHTRAPLTEAESAHLLPLYREAQLHGNTERDKARIAQRRADIAKRYATVTANAKTEHDGLLWLMDHGIKTDNVIFYSHTGRFGFGWRQPVGPELLSELLNIISEFPFPYDIETAEGRKLSGD